MKSVKKYKKKIAYIGSLKSFFDGRYHQKGGNEIKYLCVQCIKDTEGWRFDDYIIGANACSLSEFHTILPAVQSKIRKQKHV